MNEAEKEGVLELVDAAQDKDAEIARLREAVQNLMSLVIEHARTDDAIAKTAIVEAAKALANTT